MWLSTTDPALHIKRLNTAVYSTGSFYFVHKTDLIHIEILNKPVKSFKKVHLDTKYVEQINSSIEE